MPTNHQTESCITTERGALVFWAPAPNPRRQNTKGFATRVINAEESDDPSDPALRLATMHRVKGLEFDQVFLPGLDASQMPLQIEVNKRPDALSRDLFEQQERSLLHVAATRAKKRVVVSYSGKASPFIGQS